MKTMIPFVSRNIRCHRTNVIMTHSRCYRSFWINHHHRCYFTILPFQQQRQRQRQPLQKLPEPSLRRLQERTTAIRSFSNLIDPDRCNKNVIYR